MTKGLNIGGHTIKAFWLIYFAKLIELSPACLQTAQQKGEMQWVYSCYYYNCK